MAIYLGNSDKQKVILNGKIYCLNLFSKIFISNDNILVSSDNYMLLDKNELYLITKGEI